MFDIIGHQVNANAYPYTPTGMAKIKERENFD